MVYIIKRAAIFHWIW